MPHTPAPTATFQSAKPSSQARHESARGAAAAGAPLLQLHAHWQTRTHPRYLAAANFHWR
ncbi:hypothetical protein [Ramlibacter tataouinensis]|uniref:hypothetical protein n=1 Tax=Ramlibacter tataouinensis TaxID=94132 RepID=UPI0002F41F16|nr:hypothetical protein [Ramlibacter tataouinensis]